MEQEASEKLRRAMARAMEQVLRSPDGCAAEISLPGEDARGAMEVRRREDRWVLSLTVSASGAYTTRYYARGGREDVRRCCLSRTPGQWAEELLSLLRELRQMYYP